MSANIHVRHVVRIRDTRGGYVYATVDVDVDTYAIALKLASKARGNKSKRSKLTAGVTATFIREE